MIVYGHMSFTSYSFSDFGSLGMAYIDMVHYDTEVPVWYPDVGPIDMSCDDYLEDYDSE